MCHRLGGTLGQNLYDKKGIKTVVFNFVLEHCRKDQSDFSRHQLTWN